MSFEIKNSSINGINFKIILIGENNVGKTSIIRRYLENKFYDRKTNTFNLDHKNLKIKKDNKNFTLHFWNTAGHQEYRVITANLLKGSSAILVVIDINDPKSIENLNEWKNMIDNILDTKAIVILLGNKNDLIKNENYPIPLEDYNKLIKEYGWDYFELISAKTNYNMDSLLNWICDECYKNQNNDLRYSYLMNSSVLCKKKKYRRKSMKKGCC